MRKFLVFLLIIIITYKVNETVDLLNQNIFNVDEIIAFLKSTGKHDAPQFCGVCELIAPHI